MKAKWLRVFALIAVVVLIGGTFAFLREEQQRERAIEGEMPPALGKHIEKFASAKMQYPIVLAYHGSSSYYRPDRPIA